MNRDTDFVLFMNYREDTLVVSCLVRASKGEGGLVSENLPILVSTEQVGI